jgi:hypothetical protein
MLEEQMVRLEIERLNAEDIPTVARIHYDLFGTGEMHGYSIAKLGPEFLERVFYALNLHNPHFYCDVARYNNQIVGFSVYSTDRNNVFRYMFQKHVGKLLVEGMKLAVKRPTTITWMFNNLQFSSGEKLPWLESVTGWWQVAGVLPEYRTKEFKLETGLQIALELFTHMEQIMRAEGCNSWYGVVHPDNAAINIFLQKQGAQFMDTAWAQGMKMNYYVKRFSASGQND